MYAAAAAAVSFFFVMEKKNLRSPLRLRCVGDFFFFNIDRHEYYII